MLLHCRPDGEAVDAFDAAQQPIPAAGAARRC
jgi:hypothetical protein